MKAVFGTFLGRAMIAVALTVTSITLTSAGAQAVSSRATNGQTVCDIVVNPAVRIVSKNPCVVQIRVGGNVRLNLGTGFKWGNPVSSSHSVAVTSISRNSIGVDSAILHAAKIGRATIHDTGTEACSPGLMCPDLAILWSLQVNVTKTV